MSTYLLNSISNLKNKDIESLTNSKTIDELLNYTNPNTMILNSLINNTINELKDNKHFFNTNIEKIKIKDIELFDDYVGDKKELEKIIKSNDIDAFLAIFKDVLTSKIEDQSKNNTYELIGSYVNTINSISKKGLINVDYMNLMVDTINKIKGVDASTINTEGYLINKIKVFLASNPASENKVILVKAHMKLFKKDDDGKCLADDMSNDEIIRDFYKNITFSDGKSRMVPEYSSLQQELINDGFSIRETSIEKHNAIFSSINNLKQILSNLDNIKDYSLDDLKQFFEIVFLEKNDLSEYLGKSENLKSIKNNEFLSTIDFSKLMLTDEQIKKIDIVMNISNFNSSVNDLYGTDININVSELFSKKFNTNLDSKDSKKYTKQLLEKYIELKETTKNRNNNILLYIALFSFDENTKEYSKEKESKAISLLTKPHNKYSESEIKSLDSIEDNWLRWAICHNREFKDNTLTFTSVHPITFNFGEFALAKKELGRDLNKEEIELVQASSLFPNLNYTEALEFAPKSEKQRNILSNFLNTSKFNIKLDSVGKGLTKDEFYNTLNLYTVFNNNLDLLKEVNNSGLDISSLLKSDKESIQKVMSNLSNFNEKEITAIGKMLENPKVVPGNLSNLSDYIKYYAKKMDDISYKLYKKENSTIPILDYKISKDYDMKSLTIKEFSAILNGAVCNHCMSYNGASWAMIDYMFKKPENFLITQLEKNGTGIANSATWRVDNQLCFDSIEVVNNGQGVRDSILMAYREHTLKILTEDKTIDRVTFGYSNHNNQVDFSRVGIKESGTTHPFVPLPVNVYSDAKSNQSIIFTTNGHDLLKANINNFMIKSLFEYSEYKDAKHDVIKKFLESYSSKLDVIAEMVDIKVITGLSEKKTLETLLYDYNVYNKTLDNPMKKDKELGDR